MQHDNITKNWQTFMIQLPWQAVGNIGYAQDGCDKIAKQAFARKININASFDLHGLDANEAYAEIADIVNNNNKRCLLIIHGIGQNILKKIVQEYCFEHPKLLACITAPASLGGAGATIILFKRSKGDH